MVSGEIVFGTWLNLFVCLFFKSNTRARFLTGFQFSHPQPNIETETYEYILHICSIFCLWCWGGSQHLAHASQVLHCQALPPALDIIFKSNPVQTENWATFMFPVRVDFVWLDTKWLRHLSWFPGTSPKPVIYGNRFSGTTPQTCWP